jgi:serine/threonine-protein kinase
VFLGKLEVRALLGKGGHAWVYECFDRFLKRSVAVKVIKTLREVGRDLGKRAQSEAVVLASMTHPNLVRVIDAGISDGLVYIVMEKLEGRTLRQALMATGRLPVAEALTIALQIADGMQAAHEHGVIHRDLKPENIFIEPPNRVKVLDFGIAKVLGSTQMTTQKDRLQGTVLYMSPEQLQGLTATPTSDVFALGTMLFEMLCAHPLTLGGALPNNEHAAWMQLYRDPPRLETVDPKIPRYVGKLVARAIVKLPSERYPSMRELREAAFQALQRYRSEQAMRPGEQPRDLTTEPIGPLDPSAIPPATVAIPGSQAALGEGPDAIATRTATHQVAAVRKPRPWLVRKETAIGFSVGFASVAIVLGARLLWIGTYDAPVEPTSPKPVEAHAAAPPVPTSPPEPPPSASTPPPSATTPPVAAPSASVPLATSTPSAAPSAAVRPQASLKQTKQPVFLMAKPQLSTSPQTPPARRAPARATARTSIF